MTATAVLLPGNMCDARLWRGGGGVVVDALLNPVIPAQAGTHLLQPREMGSCLRGNDGEFRIFDADLSLDDSIAAIAERTLAAISRPILPIGFSMGGIVALAMAARAPERLAGLVLLDTNASADLPERAAVRPRQQADVRAGYLERVVVEELKPNYLAAASRGDAALLGLLRDMAMDLGPEVFVRQSEALRTRPDLRAVLPRLTVPVLIACGAEDTLCPPEWHMAMRNAAPDATLHIVPGAGHMLPLEQPHALAELLADWLARTGIAQPEEARWQIAS